MEVDARNKSGHDVKGHDVKGHDVKRRGVNRAGRRLGAGTPAEMSWNVMFRHARRSPPRPFARPASSFRPLVPDAPSLARARA